MVDGGKKRKDSNTVVGVNKSFKSGDLGNYFMEEPKISFKFQDGDFSVDTESGKVVEALPKQNYSVEKEDEIISDWIKTFPEESRDLVDFTTKCHFSNKNRSDLAGFITSKSLGEEKKEGLKIGLGNFADNFKEQKAFVHSREVQDFFKTYSMEEDQDKLGTTILSTAGVFENDVNKFKDSVNALGDDDLEKYKFTKLMTNFSQFSEKATAKEKEQFSKALKGSLDPENPTEISDEDNKLFKQVLDRKPNAEQEEKGGKWQRYVGLGAQGITRTAAVPAIVGLDSLTGITGTLREWTNNQSNVLVEFAHNLTSIVNSMGKGLFTGLDKLEKMVIDRYSTEEEKKADKKADQKSIFKQLTDPDAKKELEKAKDDTQEALKKNYQVDSELRETIETNDLNAGEDDIGISNSGSGHHHR